MQSTLLENMNRRLCTYGLGQISSARRYFLSGLIYKNLTGLLVNELLCKPSSLEFEPRFSYFLGMMFLLRVERLM